MNIETFKSLKYLFSKDKKFFIKFFMKNPFFYFFNFLTTIFKAPCLKNEIFFFGVKDLKEFKQSLDKKFLLIALPYCLKPKDCPAKQFSSNCFNCNKCIIGKIKNKKFQNKEIFIVTTTISLGKKFFDLLKNYSSKNLMFLIFSCPFSIEKFKFIPNILKLKGIAVPINGDICNDMETFIKAENGIKDKKTELFSEELTRIFHEKLKKNEKRIF